MSKWCKNGNTSRGARAFLFLQKRPCFLSCPGTAVPDLNLGINTTYAYVSNAFSSTTKAALVMSCDNSCRHFSLSAASSSHADKVGYRRPAAQQRATAAGKKKNEVLTSDADFPAPLVLPGDDLSLDPKAPPQSLLSWVREKARNEVTSRKNILYVADSPGATRDAEFVHKWSVPQKQKGQTRGPEPARPGVQDVMKYLTAFYHGMKVKLLPPDSLCFTQWVNSKPKANSGLIGLNTTSESVGIRFRVSPDGIFHGQLNLDDLLDTAISALPDDAYALLMLVEHDLFEDEDDDFCCGRAYGGSRVAVVSMARYNPVLDQGQNVERQHAWPASHCEAYIRSCCGEPARSSSKFSMPPAVHSSQALGLPLQVAVAANEHELAKQPPTNPGLLAARWLSRVCQIASHELGHCFGMGHCVYYACVMQSTSSLAEDVRQPPYLCPVDLAKVLRATGADQRERYATLRAFCRDSNVPMFVAFHAWLGARLVEIDGTRESILEGSTTATSLGSKDRPIEL